MIFAPFTGKDNHGKLVIFGAALMSGENHEAYMWVFEKFVECMKRHPGMIITDQDPAMKIAVKKIFPNTRHRLCMWHIMMKVPQNAPIHLRKDETFLKRLNATVWSEVIEPSVFEDEWNTVMMDFELSGNSWFSSLYEIRRFWIPAYFRDHAMSRLCRTTSISESTNSFFNNYLNPGLNLVEFLMHYDRAIDAQRNSYDVHCSVDYSSTPRLVTPLPFEKHAATIYTTKIFLQVQEQIEAACFDCSVVGIKEDGVAMLYEVQDGTGACSTVLYNKDVDSLVCSCKKFVMEGIFCCHVFNLFKVLNWKTIPEKYILSRWTKAAYLNPLSDRRDDSLDRAVQQVEKKQLLNQLISSFFACVGVVEDDNEQLTKLMGGIDDLRAVLISGVTEGTNSSNNKSKLFDMFYGSSKPAEVIVSNPIQVSHKGGNGRIETRRAKAIERANKPKRMCNKCKELSSHDARNCPQKNRDI